MRVTTLALDLPHEVIEHRDEKTLRLARTRARTDHGRTHPAILCPARQSFPSFELVAVGFAVFGKSFGRGSTQRLHRARGEKVSRQLAQTRLDRPVGPGRLKHQVPDQSLPTLLRQALFNGAPEPRFANAGAADHALYQPLAQPLRQGNGFDGIVVWLR